MSSKCEYFPLPFLLSIDSHACRSAIRVPHMWWLMRMSMVFFYPPCGLAFDRVVYMCVWPPSDWSAKHTPISATPCPLVLPCGARTPLAIITTNPSSNCCQFLRLSVQHRINLCYFWWFCRNHGGGEDGWESNGDCNGARRGGDDSGINVPRTQRIVMWRRRCRFCGSPTKEDAMASAGARQEGRCDRSTRLLFRWKMTETWVPVRSTQRLLEGMWLADVPPTTAFRAVATKCSIHSFAPRHRGDATWLPGMSRVLYPLVVTVWSMTMDRVLSVHIPRQPCCWHVLQVMWIRSSPVKQKKKSKLPVPVYPLVVILVILLSLLFFIEDGRIDHYIAR
jgi:hypothetical protein